MANNEQPTQSNEAFLRALLKPYIAGDTHRSMLKPLQKQMQNSTHGKAATRSSSYESTQEE